VIPKRKVLSGVGALAMIVAVGACSSSSKSSSSSSSTSAPAGSSGSGQTTAAPIKVGVVCSCSGPFGADILPAENVYKAWVSSVNASGGLQGHQVQLITEDDAATPGTSASDAQTLISDHVDAIVDLSIVDETWASTVQQANIPVVGSNETETPFTTNPDFYSEGQTNDSVIVANILTAKAAGAKNLGTYYCAEAPSCQEGVAPLKAAGAKYGVPVVYNGEVAATAPNYTAQCLAAQQAHASAIFIGDASFVIARIGKDCATQNYYPTYVTEGEGFANVLLTAPGISKNLWSEYSTIPFWDTSVPAVQAMNTAVDKYYPGIRSNNETWSEEAAESWAAGLLLRDAVKAGGLTPSATPSASEIVTGLNSLKNDTLDGMAPPLSFTAGQPHTIDCWFTAKLVNGTPSMVNNGQVTCSNGSSSS